MNALAIALVLALVGADPGTTAFSLLKIGQGPRAAAMGEAFTGLSDDASAVYWNPAGLGQLNHPEFALSHQQWFAGITDEVGHAVLPVGPGALGFGLLYTGEPDVQYWDETQQQYASFRAWSAVLSAGYGVRISDKYRVGAGFTGVFQELKFEQPYGGAMDIGVSGNPVPGLGLGISARHFGAVMFSSGGEPLPMEVAAGAAYRLRILRMTLDGVFPVFDNKPSVRCGVEFSPAKALAIRLGYRTGPVHLASLGSLSGLSGGIGINVGNFGVDYAFVPYGDLGLTHRIGIRTVVKPPEFGSQTVVVLDDETKSRVVANLLFAGVIDTTVTDDEITLRRLRPGQGFVRASVPGYKSGITGFTVVAGRRHRDTVVVSRLLAGIRGGIYDAKTRRPIGGTIAFWGPSSDRKQVSGSPGTFVFTGLAGGRYRIDASGPTSDYEPQTVSVDVGDKQTVERDFYLWRKGDFIVLEGVNFKSGRADILPEFEPVLDRAGEILVQTTTLKKVELAGHTDARPIQTARFPSNRELSRARAAAVRNYLIKKFGIAPERLIARGYAATKPIASNDTPEGRAKNRRTELRIIE